MVVTPQNFLPSFPRPELFSVVNGQFFIYHLRFRRLKKGARRRRGPFGKGGGRDTENRWNGWRRRRRGKQCKWTVKVERRRSALFHTPRAVHQNAPLNNEKLGGGGGAPLFTRERSYAPYSRHLHYQVKGGQIGRGALGLSTSFFPATPSLPLLCLSPFLPAISPPTVSFTPARKCSKKRRKSEA